MTFLLPVNLYEYNQYDESGKLQVKLEYDDDWKISRKHIFTYDELGRMIKWYYINLNYDISFDENNLEFSTMNYVYNTKGLLVEEFEINSNIDLNYRSLIGFDDNKNEVERTIYDSKGFRKFRFSYKYNSQNQYTETIKESFNSYGCYKSKSIFEYDSNENLIKKTEYNQESEIVKVSIFKYNEFSKLIEWSEYEKDKYLKFTLKLFYCDEQLIRESVYTNTNYKSKYCSKYDKNGNVIEKIDYSEKDITDQNEVFENKDINDLGFIGKNNIQVFERDGRLVKEMKYNPYNNKLTNQKEYVYNSECKPIQIINTKSDYFSLSQEKQKEIIIFHPLGYPIQKSIVKIYKNGNREEQKYFYKLSDNEYVFERIYYELDSENQEKEVINFNKNGIKIFHRLLGNVGSNKVNFIKQYTDTGDVIEINYFDISNNYSRFYNCEYDSNGNLIKIMNKEDNSIIESNKYDLRLKMIENVKFRKNNIYEKQEYRYDEKGNLIEECILSKDYGKCRKQKKFFDLGDDNYLSRSTLMYNEKNQLIKRTFYKSDNEINVITELKYNNNNNIIEWSECSSEEIINFRIKFDYDSNFNLVKWSEFDHNNNLVEEKTCNFFISNYSENDIALENSLKNYKDYFFRKFVLVPGRHTMLSAPLYFYFDGTTKQGEPNFID